MRIGTVDEVRSAVAAFKSLIPSMKEPRWHTYPNETFKIPRSCRNMTWKNAPGIYAFYTGRGELRYIGRALHGVGLGSRIPDHLKASRRGYPDWEAVLDDPDAFVDICELDTASSFWAPSLELYLCDQFEGLVNRRRS